MATWFETHFSDVTTARALVQREVNRSVRRQCESVYECSWDRAV